MVVEAELGGEVSPFSTFDNCRCTVNLISRTAVNRIMKATLSARSVCNVMRATKCWHVYVACQRGLLASYISAMYLTSTRPYNEVTNISSMHVHLILTHGEKGNNARQMLMSI